MTITSIDIEKLPIIKEHLAPKGTSLKAYINDLIREDLLQSGNERIVEKYFKRKQGR